MTARDLVMASAGGSSGSSTDPYIKNVSLLLSGDGTNGKQNNTFVDSSSNNFTITRNGNTTQGTFSPYGNLWSNYFNGSTDYLRVPQSTGLQFGTGDFTIEFWFNTNSSGLYVLFDTRSGSNGAYSTMYLNGTTPVYYSNTTDVITGSSLSVNTWYHWAVCRSGTSTKMFINGSQVGSTYSDTTNYVLPSYTIIGRSSNLTDYSFPGYISNLRVVKGTALYTSNFTPSTTPLTAVSGTSLLTCQSNRFIDNSSNNLTITPYGTPSVQRFSPFNPTVSYSAAAIGGSGYFDGTGDYLQLAGSSNLVLGTNSFTLEAWLYPIGNGSIYSNTDSWQAGRYNWVLGQGGSGVLSFIVNSIGDTVTVTGVKYNAWNHIAVTRSGSNWYGFLNGVLSATFTSATSIGDPSNIPIRMGITDGGSAMPLNGMVSNLRVVIGTAVYTSSFTPPTAPLTAISNTQLLMSYTNAGIPDAAMMNDLETVGNAQVSTSVKKYGTGSIYIPYDSSSVKVKPNDNKFSFGTGAFTIESWVNVTTATPNGWFLVSSNEPYTSDSELGWLIGYNVAATDKFTAWYNNNGTSVVLTTTSTFSTGTWYHVALTYDKTTLRLFINGNLEASATGSYNNNRANQVLFVSWAPVSGVRFSGYIDDLRITKGYARYTANFTPPAQALPTN